MDLGLEGKVAMIGGASRGLGFAIAEALVSEGARVSIASRHEAAIRQAAQRLAQGRTAEVLPVAADVSRAADIAAWHRATVEHWGGVDILVCNSGGPPAGTFQSLVDDASWQSAFELLVLSAIRLVRTVLPSMKGRTGASILLLTSSAVKEPIANLVLSNVLRASVAALAKSLANELAADGIRVNHLLPGRISTDRLRELDQANAARAGISVEEQQRRVTATIPLQRYGSPEEFARAAAFLVSQAASYITGASLQVDGGLIRSVM
jgi:3-oxoacyl-[acyl-carrier protein] reductase